LPAIQLSNIAATLSPYDVVASGGLNLPTHAMLFVGKSVRTDVEMAVKKGTTLAARKGARWFEWG